MKTDTNIPVLLIQNVFGDPEFHTDTEIKICDVLEVNVLSSESCKNMYESCKQDVECCGETVCRDNHCNLVDSTWCPTQCSSEWVMQHSKWKGFLQLQTEQTILIETTNSDSHILVYEQENQILAYGRSTLEFDCRPHKIYFLEIVVPKDCQDDTHVSILCNSNTK